MIIHSDFITEGDEDELRCHIELGMAGLRQNQGSNRNRILRFGRDYKQANVWLADIPEWLERPMRNVLPMREMASVSVNEYLRGQAIAPHIDNKDFGDVYILSLLAGVTMRFISLSKDEDILFDLPRRSLAVMSGELRHEWHHSTLPLEADKRISVAYRRRLK